MDSRTQSQSAPHFLAQKKTPLGEVAERRSSLSRLKGLFSTAQSLESEQRAETTEEHRDRSRFRNDLQLRS